jgi:hypothetical protein
MLAYLVALSLFAQTSIDIKSKPAQFVTISTNLSGDIVKYVTLDAGLSVFPSELLADKKKTVVVAAKNGVYKILAYTAKDNVPSDPVIINLIISDNDNPPDVNIFDEYVVKFKRLYDLESSPNKRNDLEEMIYCLKTSMTLSYEKLSNFNEKLRKDLVKFDLPIIKKELGNMLSIEYGTDDKEMDVETQTKLNKFLIKVVSALEKVK